MDSKVCVICKTEKSNDNFYNQEKKCKPSNIKRSLKPYCDERDKTSSHQKL